MQRGNRELATHLAFEPHLMGPHSDVLEGETEQLELSGLVDSAQGLYSLTPLGEEVAKNVAKTVPIQEIELVEQTKELLNDLHRDELLALVYFGMVPPEYKDESEEYERIRRNRIPLALRLLKKEKISAGKAAEIAGVSVDELIARFDQLPA